MRILIFVLVVTLNTVSYSLGYSGSGSGSTEAGCSAYATFSPFTTTCRCYDSNCGAGTSCKCKAGLVSVTCGCKSNGNNVGPSDYVKPNLDTQTLDDIDLFRDYCLNYNSSQVNNLVNYIDQVIDKYHNGSSIEFGVAEIAYIDFFQNNLSQTEIVDINNWVVNKGYQSFL